MNTRITRTIGAVAAAAAILGGLTACDQAKDAADSATSKAGDAAGQATSKAGDAAAQATSKAGEAAGGGANASSGAAAPSGSGAPEGGAEAKEPVPSTKIATAGGQEVTLNDQAIIGEYAKYGYEKGHLGAPLGPVSALPDGKGKYLTLKGGTIYWSQASGAHVVHGVIGDKWGDEGHEAGKLGYPTSDETAEDGGIVQKFQKGTITFKDGKATVS
ncbi:LGFP repeat-containing protein [Tsukamurella sp. 1534]|uniref:LGFP repeat-containing protein n=1 Tax=Tsukamurella sp. 1534 TaxID=1151061 RepID=UPI0002E29F86|nr:hypothetical protein [Tsukamurella sp. 1534]